jgi:hypothetical protein
MTLRSCHGGDLILNAKAKYNLRDKFVITHYPCTMSRLWFALLNLWQIKIAQDRRRPKPKADAEGSQRANEEGGVSIHALLLPSSCTAYTLSSLASA